MATRTHPDPATLDGTYMSEEEYRALPEMSGHVELVDGLIVCEPSATFGHQRASIALATALEIWSSTRSPRPTIVAAPLDVRFAPSRILQPDIVIFCEPLVPPVAMPIARIPDLCVEIVSRHPSYDRTAKRIIYAAAGVKEMWTVVRKWGLVERWTGDGLETREECRERLASPLLPGFETDVAALLAD